MEQEPSKDAIKSNKSNGIEFKEGNRLEARDHLGDKWWDAKIIEVDHEGCEVLVHFQGWNGRHDEWIKMDSPRLQPLHRRSRRLSSGPVVDNIASPGPSSSPSPSSLTGPTHAGPALYSIGEEVLALWKQNRKFPATILKFQEDGGYLVRFYDGFEKIVRGQCIRRIGKQDHDFVAQCKQQIVTNGDSKDNGMESDIKSDLNNDVKDAPPTKLRRERKSKFNVREILNLAPAKKPSPSINRSRENSQDSPKPVIDKNSEGLKKICLDSVSSDTSDLNDSLDSKSEKSISETGSEGTPSEKENYNCDVLGKFKSKSKDQTNDKSSQDKPGKRERKRKRFADEEPEAPRKVSKKSPVNNISTPSSKVKPVSKSSRVPPKSDHTPSKPQVLSQFQNKGNKTSDPTEVPSKKKPKDKAKINENKVSNKVESAVNIGRSVKSSVGGVSKKSEKFHDKNFSYLSFDFSLPQEKMVSNLVEGITIPGSDKPVFIKAPKLPPGWVKKVYLRGVNNLKWEVVIENSLGKSFKSRAELVRYFDEQKSNVSETLFDFSLDTTLKKIRHIWRESLKQTDNNKSSLTNGTSEPLEVTLNNVESRIPIQGNVIVKSSPPSLQSKKLTLSSSSSKSSESSQPKLPPSSTSSSHPFPSSSLSLPTPTHNSTSDTLKVKVSPPVSNHQSSPLSSPGSKQVNSSLFIKGNASETGQGVRCPLKTCNKLFRNDKLLQMHGKHYHPELAVEQSPTITEVASPRPTTEVETGNGMSPPLINNDVKLKSPETTSDINNSKEVLTFKSPIEVVKKSVKIEAEVVKKTVKSETDSVKKNKVEDEVESVAEPIKTELVEVKEETAVASDPVPVENVADPEPNKIVDTPKTGKARPRRLRKDSMLSITSDTVFSPPASPSPGTSVSLKMSKTRAQLLRSAPTSPPAELKDGTETMSEGEVVHCTFCLHTEGDGMMVQCESCLTWQHGSCLGIESADQVPEKYVCSVCIAPPLARQSLLYNIDMDWIREGRITRMNQEPEEGVKKIEEELKTLSETMADLVNLSSVLHSLQVKLSVAKQKNNPKVFMWSNVWDDSAIGVTEEEVNTPEENINPIENDSTFESVNSMENDEIRSHLQLVKKELENHVHETSKVVNGIVNHEESETVNKSKTSVINEFESNHLDKSSPKTDVDSGVESAGTDNVDVISDIIESGNTIDVKDETDATEPKNDNSMDVIEAEVSKPTKDQKNTSENVSSDSQNSFTSQLADILTSDGFDIQNLLPSVSEMQRMLPDVIKDISGSLNSTPAFNGGIINSPTAPNIIPEPKRLDRDECRQNLLEHIEALQKHVEDRLEAVEDKIENIEKKRKDSPGVWSGLIMSQKIKNVQATKIVNRTLPDRF